MRGITIALAFAVAVVCAAQETSVVVSVCGAEKMNPTGITVRAGQRWKFEVIGSSPACDDCRHGDPRLSECDRPDCAQWSDGKRMPRRSAEGWELWYLRPFFFLKRVRSAHWYELTGAVYKDDRVRQTFAIGKAREEPIKAEGELVLFANDASWRYANNYGSLRVRITRVE